MSNGAQWRSYIHGDREIKQIEAYLENPVPAQNYLGLTGLRISFATLIQDTNYNKAPTTEWYTLHMCVQDKHKWAHRPLSWGLNRKRLDMYKLQHDIISRIMEARRKATERGKNTDMAVLPLDDLNDTFRQGYQDMAPKFVNVTVPASWYLEAQHNFVARCKASAIAMLARCFYDKKSHQLTQAGEDNWHELYRNSDLPEELVRPSLTLEGNSEDEPPKEAFLPHMDRMPAEICARILDYALDPPILGQESGFAKTSTWLRDNARDWSCRQLVTIRARHWPWNPPRRFPDDRLPVEWLQTVQKVRFDFDGVSYSDRKIIHPVMVQLADIWRTNELRSLVLPIAPQMKYLAQEKPRIELDQDQKYAFVPILGILSIEPKYVADFGAPVTPSGSNSLSEIASAAYDSFENSLPFVLDKAQSLINMKSGKDSATPLHRSVICSGTRNINLLLSTPGIDVNVQDKNGDTAFDRATGGGSGVREALLLARHKDFRVTEDNFVNALNRMCHRQLIAALCDNYGGVPSHIAHDPKLGTFVCEAFSQYGTINR